MNSFDTLISCVNVLKAIAKAGFTKPTGIQLEAIPLIDSGKDLLGAAQTGTGKTAAYLLPMLNKISLNPIKNPKGPRVLILVPTRELALQVTAEAEKYSEFLSKASTVCIYGGVPYPVQNRQLSRPFEILVATPGRLIDHLERNRIDLSNLEVLILDEADRMLDMGFIAPVEQIAQATPANRQTLLFSATLCSNVRRLSSKLMNNPAEINVESGQEKHENIEQRLYYVDDLSHKHRILNHLLNDPTINQAIVFTSTKRYADQLVDDLLDNGYDAAALHGDMDQRQRTRTITRLREGKIRFLIATDVAARGIDVNTITHVFNFDMPNNVEDYVHRIGRTGRAGASGIAMSFAANQDRHLVVKIEKYTGQTITSHVVVGLEPTRMNPAKSAPGGKRRRPQASRRSNSYRPAAPRDRRRG